MSGNQTSADFSYENILKKAVDTNVSPYSFKRIYPAYIILIVMAIISIGVWQLVTNQVKTDRSIQFDKAVNSVVSRIESEHQKNTQVLTSVRGLYDNLVQVVRDYFNLYASIPTSTNEALLGVIYSPSVKSSEKDAYLYNIRSQGFYFYEIKPVGQRPLYYPVQFIVPLERNEHMSGYDFATDPLAFDAIKKAIDSNMIITTPVYEIRKPDTAGFYMISPVYRKGSDVSDVDKRRANYTGSVIVEVNSKLFFKKSLGSGNQSDTTIIFECFNEANSGGTTGPLYQSANIGLLKTKYTPDRMDKQIQFADKTITIKFYTIPKFGGSFQRFLPYLALIMSLALSVIFFFFMVNTINRKQSALGLAEKMTRSQRRITESSNDIISVLDYDGIWKSMNPASLRILEYEPDELIENKVDNLFVDHDDLTDFYDMLSSTEGSFTRIVDWQMKTKTEQIKWVSWSLSFSPEESLIYCIGRDVTLEKIAEEQDKIRNKQILLAEQLSREASQYKSTFITKLSHMLRNSLTGILGYLDLVSLKAYETEEELDSYIGEATQSSREILDFVMDTSDTWGISGSGRDRDEDLMSMTPIKLEDVFKDASAKFLTERSVDQKVIVKNSDSIANALAVADKKLLTETLLLVYKAFSEDLETGTITVDTADVKGEDATEIVIKAPTTELSVEMIDLYNKNIGSLIDTLKLDKKDVLLKFALAASDFRLMSGKTKIGKDKNSCFVNVILPKIVQQD